MAIQFEEFIIAVPEAHQQFVCELHEELTKNGCVLEIKEAKSGYMVSYKQQKKTVLNWVFRKSGIMARIYGDHARQYESVIGALPAEMRATMKSSAACKRLLDPLACSPTCVQGMIYNMDGELHKKCRYSGMFFVLSEQNAPFIKELVVSELAARKAG